MQAEPHGGTFLGVLGRVLAMAGCALGLAFVIALLTPGAGTAHATASVQPGIATPARDVVDDASATAAFVPFMPDADVATDPPGITAAPDLWADPVTLTATATRRAGAGDAVAPASATVIQTTTTDRLLDRPNPPDEPLRAARSVVVAATPLGGAGSAGFGSAAPDAGPSAVQLAVLTATLALALWLSQRVLAREVSWRSALILSILERPG